MSSFIFQKLFCCYVFHLTIFRNHIIVKIIFQLLPTNVINIHYFIFSFNIERNIITFFSAAKSLYLFLILITNMTGIAIVFQEMLLKIICFMLKIMIIFTESGNKFSFCAFFGTRRNITFSSFAKSLETFPPFRVHIEDKV